MITGKMSIMEINNEVMKKDLDFLTKASENFIKRNNSALLKRKKELRREKPESCRRFVTFFKTKSPLTRNSYFVVISYLKNYSSEFIAEFFTIFEDSNGRRSFIVVCENEDPFFGYRKLLYSFDFHIITRFKERSGFRVNDFDESLKKFFSDLFENRLYFMTEKSERFTKNRETSATLRISTGVLIGTQVQDHIFYKTFVSNEMLFDNQEILLDSYELDEVSKYGHFLYDSKKYGDDIIKSQTTLIKK